MPFMLPCKHRGSTPRRGFLRSLQVTPEKKWPPLAVAGV